MTSSGANYVRAGYSWIGILLFTLALSLLAAAPARAEDCVADFGGVIDGNVVNPPPSQIQIDGNCTIRNFPASNPLTSNISFFGNNPTSWLVIFDNVVFTGNMSCNLNSQGNLLWFTNGSTSELKQSCLNLLIPVEKINKQNPAGQTTATIGVPFTYKLTIPVLFDPATGTVINASGSPNDLHGITVTDDLNATGASSQLCEPRRLLARQQHAGAAHVLRSGRFAHLRQLPHRPGRAAVRYRNHSRAQRHAGERAGGNVLQHGQVGLRTAHRRRVLRAAAGRVGRHPTDDDCRHRSSSRPSRARRR